MQLIIGAWWGLNRPRCRGLFVLLTHIVDHSYGFVFGGIYKRAGI